MNILGSNQKEAVCNSKTCGATELGALK
jgi:hypothetical protein